MGARATRNVSGEGFSEKMKARVRLGLVRGDVRVSFHFFAGLGLLHMRKQVIGINLAFRLHDGF